MSIVERMRKSVCGPAVIHPLANFILKLRRWRHTRPSGPRLQVLETPGQTISILVFDLQKDLANPHTVLTGDTLFIGDVGRPDLRASPGWTANDLGAHLYDSLRNEPLPMPRWSHRPNRRP